MNAIMFVYPNLEVPSSAKHLRWPTGDPVVHRRFFKELLSRVWPPVFRPDHNRVAEAFAWRERLGPTGMGGGFGFPHADIKGFGTIPIVFACRFIREFYCMATLDGSAIEVLFLTLIPHYGDGKYLHSLTRTLKVARALLGKPISPSSFCEEILKVFGGDPSVDLQFPEGRLS
jgi:hypothetical protein